MAMFDKSSSDVHGVSIDIIVTHVILEVSVSYEIEDETLFALCVQNLLEQMIWMYCWNIQNRQKINEMRLPETSYPNASLFSLPRI